MMRGETARRDSRNSGYLCRTASHMADAVSYLESVAQDTGMPAIAAKLASVRSDLVSMVREGETPSEKTETPDGGRKVRFCCWP